MLEFFDRWLNRRANFISAPHVASWDGEKAAPPPAPQPAEIPAVDPLDPISKIQRWPEPEAPKLRSISEFPVYPGYVDDEAGEEQATQQRATRRATMDSARTQLVKSGAMMDSNGDGTGELKLQGNYQVPFALQSWYLSQGFIGYQACATIAQHWLVDKACSMAGEDAARNGWTIKARSGQTLSNAQQLILREGDVTFSVKENLIELNRFRNIFGIRVAIFKVRSDDPDYYEKPFNLDGITPGSYEGISQVDPYWMMPMLKNKNTADPSKIGFYEPEYWVIDGVPYHKSHLIIVRGPQPADILKPTYIFGGIPLTQRIYERVYAAERTANEAPLLSMSKRTTALHVDMERVLADQCGFEQRLLMWLRFRDNHAVKVLGKDETMEQFDTNLSDFDSIIMNQYQIVAAIARVPATKLLGTSPKGFNATGEFETVSYHEELESIQEHCMVPMLQRHYDILCRSESIQTRVEVVCNPVDSITTKDRADLNDKKATTGVNLINAGVIAPDEERQRLRDDEHSGYNRLTDVDAESEPGASPENLAEFEKAGAAQTKAGAAETTATKPGEPGKSGGPDAAETDVAGEENPALRAAVLALISGIAKGPDQKKNQAMTAMLLALLHSAVTAQEPEPQDALIRGTKPGTSGSIAPRIAPSTVAASEQDCDNESGDCNDQPFGR